MDTRLLRDFFRELNHWPKDEAELGAAADSLRRLLAVPLVALGDRKGTIRVSGADSDALFAGVSAGLRVHLEGLSRWPSEGAEPDRRLLLFGFPVKGGAGVAVEQWLAHPIRLENRSVGFTGAPEVERLDLGWIAVGLPRRADPRDFEAALMLVAHHLASLGERAQLESAISQRDQFLSIASHELKTPLTSIYGILQLQERMLRPKDAKARISAEQERQRSFFKIVIRQVERLNELIDALLDVSRICNGRFNVEPSETDVAAIVTETANTRLSVLGLEAGVRIETQAPAKLNARVDPIRFEEVVTNLGMNAIRFSPEGGTVWIRLEERAGGIALSFRDQGPPVPESDRDRIFRPFERAQRTARLGGLGLGLFISKQIAQLHGGDVVLKESAVGKGNLFEARFPSAQSQQQASA